LATPDYLCHWSRRGDLGVQMESKEGYISITVFFALAVYAYTLASRETVKLDTFADIQWGTDWKLGWMGSGHEGTVLASAPDPDGMYKTCGRLDYATDPAKGKYGLCYAQIDKMIPLPETAEKISIMVYGDNSGNSLSLRLVDRYGEIFQYTIAEKIDWTGWRRCVAQIKDSRPHHFGGDENGRLDPPFSFQAISLGVTPPRITAGTIFFADLELE
jgi:hypothetical protein